MSKVIGVLGTTLFAALAACASESTGDTDHSESALIIPAKLGESCGDGVHVVRPCALGLVCVHEQVTVGGEPGSYCEEADVDVSGAK